MNIDENRKFGSPIYGGRGRIESLHGIAAIGDKVVWLGRKHGSCPDDHLFVVGRQYRVSGFLDSNHDAELELSDDKVSVTIRARADEYQPVKNKKEE